MLRESGNVVKIIVIVIYSVCIYFILCLFHTLYKLGIYN